MGVTKRQRGILEYTAVLPVEKEPEYKNGFYCDVCGAEFLHAPFYHCRSTGEDRCMRCSVSTGLHPLPSAIYDVFTAKPALNPPPIQSSTTVVPLLAYRCTARAVGIFLSDGSCLVVEVSDVSLVRGWHRSAAGDIDWLDGNDLVDAFPFVAHWGNPSQLCLQGAGGRFDRQSYGLLPPSTGGGADSIPSLLMSELMFLKAVGIGHGRQVFAFANGSMQVHDVHGGAFACWMVVPSDELPAGAAPPPPALLRSIGNARPSWSHAYAEAMETLRNFSLVDL